MTRITTFTLAVVAAIASPLHIAFAADPPKALPGAHAHNDYYHKRPLFDALDRGFTSIEADVFLVDGKLLVGHYAHELRPERSLETLYLEPLRKHIKANDGRVFAGDERLILLVDFKSDGPAAYAALAKLLEKYDGVFFDIQDGKLTPRAVDVIVTGNRPIEAIAGDKSRRAAIDGRLADLDRESPRELLPLISESWTDHFKWRGRDPIPAFERKRLHELADQVHQEGRRLRFWATSDNPAVWKELQAAGVDVIGCDDLDALKKFLAQ
jgi:glycerophosphoryl diester phosphodiesterase